MIEKSFPTAVLPADKHTWLPYSSGCPRRCFSGTVCLPQVRGNREYDCLLYAWQGLGSLHRTSDQV